MSELRDLRDHIDDRLDKLESKLDDHLERISKAEVAIVWIRGHLKVSTAIGLAVVGTIVSWWFTRISP